MTSTSTASLSMCASTTLVDGRRPASWAVAFARQRIGYRIYDVQRSAGAR